MKKVVWSLVIALLVSCTLYAVNQQKSLLEREQEMTVLISNHGMVGMGLGTGVLLDSTHVLTCHHLLHNQSDDFMVFTYPLGQVIKAHVEGGSKADDLMVLTLESTATFHTPPVFQSNYTVGEPITVIGNALGGMEWLVTKGVVSGLSQGYLLTDALINPGNSGGPWFNEKGEIVALSDWGIGPEPHIKGIAGGVSGKTINKVLDFRAQVMDQQFLMRILPQ